MREKDLIFYLIILLGSIACCVVSINANNIDASLGWGVASLWQVILVLEKTKQANTKSFAKKITSLNYKVLAALNRMFGRCTTDSVTELKQKCDSVRLLILKKTKNKWKRK